MNSELRSIILKKMKFKSIKEIHHIQTLWSGYGELSRVVLDHGSIIVKSVRYPTTVDQPRAQASHNSHRRKVKSYEVEISWYQNYQYQIPGAYFPRYIGSGQLSNQDRYLIVEDLSIELISLMARS